MTKATQDPKTNIWSVVVEKGDGTERVFNVKNIVLAIGFKGGKEYIPSIPGMVGSFRQWDICKSGVDESSFLFE